MDSGMRRNDETPEPFLKETLINPSFVIPAKAGIQKFKDMDSGLRRNDGLFRASLSKHLMPFFR